MRGINAAYLGNDASRHTARSGYANAQPGFFPHFMKVGLEGIGFWTKRPVNFIITPSAIMACADLSEVKT